MITVFTIPATSTSLTVSGIQLQAVDETGVTGFYVSDTAATPVAGSSGWSLIAPTSYPFSSGGVKSLYAWAKDATGNISPARSASVVISLPDPSDPITQITVQEALPAGIAGMARHSAPVTVGLPIADSSNINSINQLGLSGVSAAQFRPLAWWPSGNIKWVLVDFQTDLAAGGSSSNVSLVPGTGNFGGDNLAADGPLITVDTGSAVFSIRKSNFNVFDSISVGTQSLVVNNNGGAISAVGPDGTLYSSRNDSASTAIIEENGPVRAVVKATGALRSTSGVRLMDYTLRLHFYKGSARVKSYVSLRNASKLSNIAILFKSAELTVPISIDANPSVTLAGKTDTVSRSLGGTASLQQGYSSYVTYPYIATDYYNFDPPAPGSVSGSTYVYDPAYYGLKMQVGSEVINSFGNLNDWTQGFATLNDSSGKHVTAALPENFKKDVA